MTRRIHVCQSVDGALRFWDVATWAAVAEANGVSVIEARDWLREQQAAGVKVIPVGERCEGFDDVKGCPGHELPDADDEAQL